MCPSRHCVQVMLTQMCMEIHCKSSQCSGGANSNVNENSIQRKSSQCSGDANSNVNGNSIQRKSSLCSGDAK